MQLFQKDFSDESIFNQLIVIHTAFSFVIVDQILLSFTEEKHKYDICILEIRKIGICNSSRFCNWG